MGKLKDSTTELTDVAKDDFIHVVDKSDTTDDPEGTSKWISKDNFFKGQGKKVTGYDGYFVFGSGAHDQVVSGNTLMGSGAFYSGNWVIMTADIDDPALNTDFTVKINLG